MPTSKPTKKRSSSRRRDAGRPRGAPILDAVLSRTLEEIVAHGIGGANVARIAAAAEVNKTSVYRRWPTKEALVAAALERVADDVETKLEDRGSLRADLELLAATIGPLLESPLGRSLTLAAMAESESHELAEVAARHASRPRRSVATLHTRAQKRKEWREGVAPGTVLAMLVGALLHRVMLERAKLTRPFLAEIVEILARGVMP